MKKITAMLLMLCMIIALSACGESEVSSEQVKNTQSEVETSSLSTEEPLESKVTYTVEDCTNICLLRFTNNADVTVEVEVNFVFNNGGSKQDAGYGHLYCLAPGENGVISMQKPTDEYGLPIEGVTTDFQVSVSENGLFSHEGSFDEFITIEDSSDGENVTITAHNNSDKSIDNVTVAIVYYSGEEAVWYNDYGYDIAADGEYYWTFDKPHFYNTESTEISFDRYEIILNDSFNYD